jgi:hypothetical protein
LRFLLKNLLPLKRVRRISNQAPKRSKALKFNRPSKQALT